MGTPSQTGHQTREKLHTKLDTASQPGYQTRSGLGTKLDMTQPKHTQHWTQPMHQTGPNLWRRRRRQDNGQRRDNNNPPRFCASKRVEQTQHWTQPMHQNGPNLWRRRRRQDNETPTRQQQSAELLCLEECRCRGQVASPPNVANDCDN